MKYLTKLKGRAYRLYGNIIKIVSTPFHIIFPKKRWEVSSETPDISQNQQTRIPLSIWQTNFTNRFSLPLYLNHKHNRKLSKEFSYHYVSTEERDIYVKNNAPKRIFDAYSMLTDGAAQADLWRCLVLYNEGGVYMDIDATLVENLMDVISSEEQVFVKNKEGFTNFFMATHKKNPIFLEFINKIVENIENYDPSHNTSVFDTTGPGALIEILSKHNEIFFEEQQHVCIQGVFTNEYFQYIDRPKSKWIYKKTFIKQSLK